MSHLTPVPSTPSTTQLLTPPQVASLLGFSIPYVHKLIKSGLLIPVRTSLVPSAISTNPENRRMRYWFTKESVDKIKADMDKEAKALLAARRQASCR